MSAERMRTIQYSGDIWNGKSVQPELWDLLQQKDLLVELAGGPAPAQVVLGVPHHAGPGVDHIAEEWTNPKTGKSGRPADETTGLAGLAVFSALREKGIAARLVIAAHPTDHDPNKTPGCPYWQRIFERSGGPPGLLLELHGAGLHRRNALELSAGKNQAANPLLFGKILAYFLKGEWIFAIQEEPGASQAKVYRNGQHTGGRLQNPALETLSLIYAGQIGIPALHLEMKAPFRQPDPVFPETPRPTEMAWQLARALADTLDITSRSDDIHISAANLGLPSSAFLTRPSLYYEESYLSAAKEADFRALNDNPELRVGTHREFVYLVEDTSQVIFGGLPDEPPEEYLWLIDRGEFIGRAFFLHWLNDARLKTDGQVDYWIRPTRRQQGYGRLILRLLLERFRQLGLERVLITCRTDNLPSRKIIEANGGIFESEIAARDGMGYPEMRRRYWISL
jgi:predicted acetyltransferase